MLQQLAVLSCALQPHPQANEKQFGSSSFSIYMFILLTLTDVDLSSCLKFTFQFIIISVF